MAAAFDHTAIPCEQRKHMARPAEIFRFCVFIDGFHRCNGTLIGGNSGRCTHMVNGYGKSGFVIVCIMKTHRMKLQTVNVFSGHRHTDQSTGMGCHKIDIFQCCKFCGTDNVAFVFSVFIVDENNIFSRL